MTLVEFLRARLAERERRAEGSGLVAWLTYRDDSGQMLYTTVAAAAPEDPDYWVVDGRQAAGYASVNVVYDERAELAEVDAERRIVDQYERAYYGDHADEAVWEQSRREALEDVVRLLALPYANHPDYREEWKP